MPAPTRITRLAERAAYDRATLDAILDDAYVAHVGVVIDGEPAVIPFACVRVGDELVLHGSVKGGILSAVAAGTPVCATVTHLDGLVLARSAFHSSMNYRSAAVHGVARLVDDAGEKIRMLDAFVDRVLPGRRAQIRGMDAGEIAATQVIALPLDRFSAKVRTGGPQDAPEDRDGAIWGGVVPLALAMGAPRPDATTAPGTAAPQLARA